MAAVDKLKIVHVSSWAWTLGGIQSTLRHLRKRDGVLGLNSEFMGIFDRKGLVPGDQLLGARGWKLVVFLRRTFERLARSHDDAVWVYHDGWGLRWWNDLDGAQRRIVFLHTEVTNFDELVRAWAPRVDGFLSVSREMTNRVQRIVPGFPVERCLPVPFFVDEPPEISNESSSRDGRKWRIGYAGRLERAHKRVERLPELVTELTQAGVDFELEILGEGSERANLEAQLGENPRVRFLGYRKGQEYWAAIQGWDSVVLVSDYEGFSRVTMEGMACGALPVHPEFSAAAREVLGPLSDQGLYPTGDMRACALRIQAQALLPQEEITALQQAARKHLANHTVDRFESAYVSGIKQILALPKRRTEQKPAWWESLLPLGLFTRLWPKKF